MPEAPIAATLHGHVASTQDALIIIEACLRGNLSHLSRRPRQSEEPLLARSGNVFVYERRSSGITIWQDGIQWSAPVRVGNFEMRLQLATPSAPSAVNRLNGTYTPAGLCRRSLGVTVRGLTHYLVAYVDAQAIMMDNLYRPVAEPGLANMLPRPELQSQGLFTTPVEEDDRAKILRVMES